MTEPFIVIRSMEQTPMGKEDPMFAGTDQRARELCEREFPGVKIVEIPCDLNVEFHQDLVDNN